jgi:tetratricopeptide (TPR) repeat protein
MENIHFLALPIEHEFRHRLGHDVRYCSPQQRSMLYFFYITLIRRLLSRAVPVSLCILAAIACQPKAGTYVVRQREVEPRLSGYGGWRPCMRVLPEGHVVEDANCGTAERPAVRPVINCDEIQLGHEEVNTILVGEPGCTDAVIRALTTGGQGFREERILSDLAAAYYLRAQRNDDPEDLLRAFETAQRAVAKDRSLPQARFNLALTEEALGLSDQAIASWKEAAHRDSGSWAAEAAGHRVRLERERAIAAAFSVPSRERVMAAMQAGDGAAVRQLAATSPQQVRTLVEWLVFQEWAQAAATGSAGDAQRHLQLARGIASELARATGDRFLFDGIDQIAARSTSTATRVRLIEGSSAMSEGRLAQSRSNPARAASAFARAEQAFSIAGSPFVHEAIVRRAMVALELGTGTDLAARFATTAAHARVRRYQDLWSRAQTLRAEILAGEGRWAEALDALGDAATSLEKTTQPYAPYARAIRARILRTIGQRGEAWRDAYSALHHRQQLDRSIKTAIMEEAAGAAFALGYPHAALEYQDIRIKLIQEDLQAEPGEAAVNSGRLRLAAALADRASIQLSLGRVDAATAGLRAAERLGGINIPSLEARLKELEGQSLLLRDPAAAEEAFTEAVQLVSRIPDSYAASLLAQRAAARRARGDKAGAEVDWHHATPLIETRGARLPGIHTSRASMTHITD